MAIEVIFNKQTISGFTFDSVKGACRASLSGAFTLTAGQYYEVGWDGKAYTRKAYTLDGDSTVYIGNEFRQKGEIDDITEPFIVAYVPGTSQNLFYAYDTSDSHIASISTAEEPNSILVTDWHGKDHEFTGYDTVYIRNAGGDAQPYTHGLLGSDIETPADFSGGDMVLSAEDGDFVKTVTVQMPENLTTGNIAEGVDIAGIIGTMKAGGDIVAKSGGYTATATGEMEITHGLGVIPDVIMVRSDTFTTGCILMVNGISKELNNVADINAQHACNYGATATYAGYKRGINESDASGFGFINSANPKEFKVGGTLFKHSVGATYTWTAFGGMVNHGGYFYIRLSLDGDKLIITGGVPAIEQFNILVNGSMAKTVDYVYCEEFTVDLSDITTGYEPLTVTVEAVGTTLAEVYPDQYYDTVSNGITAGGTCGDNLRWVLEDSGKLTISGEGAMSNYGSASEQPWYNYASKIVSVVIEYGVTSIGNQSLRALTSLSSVSIADSVINIGTSAFLGCTALTSIDLPNSVETIGSFSFNETGLTRITIPEKVTTLYYCFYGCKKLQTVVLPDGLTSIGDYTFKNCTSLTDITIPNGVTLIGNQAFYGCTSLTIITIPDSVTSIGSYAFNMCTGLTSITIPAGVTVITDSMIRGCTSLASVTILGAITSIGQYALADSAITSFVIPDTVTIVALGAFYGCSKMTSVTIGSGVQKIGKTAFTACSKLTSATFKDTSGWYVSTSETATSGTNLTVTNKSTAATYLRSNYANYYWFDKT